MVFMFRRKCVSPACRGEGDRGEGEGVFYV